MAVVNALADLKKLEIIFDCLFVLFDIIIQNANGIVRPAFVPHLPCPPTAKSKHFVIFQSPHNCDICGVVDLFFEFLRILVGSLVEEGMFLCNSGGSIEK